MTMADIRAADPPVECGLAQSLLRTLGGRVPMVLADLAAPGRPIVYASPAFLDLAGCAAGQPLDRSWRLVPEAAPGDAAARPLEEALALGEPVAGDLVGERPDGSRFSSRMRLDPVAAEGPARYVLGIHQEPAAPAGDDKDLLLGDLRHRSDNAMQLILSLLRLRAAHATEPAAVAALASALERIEALVRVQHSLNRLGSGGGVAVGPLLEQIGRTLAGAGHEGIDLDIACDEIALPAAQVMPLVLFVNEALANALRHGFVDGRQGKVAVRLARRPGGELLLTVADDGVGLPEGFDLLRQGGLGGRLLQAFAGQLRGRIEIAGDGGLRLTLHLP